MFSLPRCLIKNTGSGSELLVGDSHANCVPLLALQVMHMFMAGIILMSNSQLYAVLSLQFFTLV